MSCCSGGYCQFQFPEGPPLTDNPVASLNAKYLFLPYGTLLEAGELIRIWTENGKTREVTLEQKVLVNVTPTGLEDPSFYGLPWSLVAVDSGWEEEDLQHFYQNPLFNPQTQAVVLVFSQVLMPRLTWFEKWHNLLYKIRNL